MCTYEGYEYDKAFSKAESLKIAGPWSCLQIVPDPERLNLEAHTWQQLEGRESAPGHGVVFWLAIFGLNWRPGRQLRCQSRAIESSC